MPTQVILAFQRQARRWISLVSYPVALSGKIAISNVGCRNYKELLAADKQLTFSIKDEDNKGNFVLAGIKALVGLEGRRYEG